MTTTFFGLSADINIILSSINCRRLTNYNSLKGAVCQEGEENSQEYSSIGSHGRDIDFIETIGR